MTVESLPWYYAAGLDSQSQQAFLEGDEWHHAHHVLRLQAGERVLLFDGRGQCFEGRIDKASKNRGEIILLHDCSSQFLPADGVRINIAFAPTKNIDRTEFAVEKLVEVGVHRIHFLETQNSERSKIRLDRMEKIAISAAKQSRKLFLPELSDMQSIQHAISEFKDQTNSTGSILCMHLDEATKPLYHNYKGETDVLVLVGPEGGFTKEEVDMMNTSGALMTSLGTYRLRVETAVITACANIHLLHTLKH